MTAVRRAPNSAWLSLAAALLILLPGALCRAQTTTYDFPAGRIAIHNLAGKAEVRAATGSGIKVEVTRGGREGGSLKVEQGPRWRLRAAEHPLSRR